MAKLVAQTYGQALYELALEENKMDELLDEVRTLSKAFTDGSEFAEFMKHPQITKEEKQSVLENSLKGRVSDDILGFLVLIAQKNRFADIIPIFEFFIEAVKKHRGIGTAYVTTPAPLNEIQKSLLTEKLLATAGFKEIETEYSIDESLIGGMIIRIGDRVVDSSIKTRLYELTRELYSVQIKN